MVNYHEMLDQRSLAMHKLIAEKIRERPELFDHPKKTLARWRVIVDQASQPYLEVWQELFDQGVEAALAVATEDSERATALRQSSPFCGVLTEEERINFLREWKARWMAEHPD